MPINNTGEPITQPAIHVFFGNTISTVTRMLRGKELHDCSAGIYHGRNYLMKKPLCTMLDTEIFSNKQIKKREVLNTRTARCYVPGCAPGVPLFIYVQNTHVFLHSLLFSVRFLPLATHSAGAKALVCLFAKRHTGKYNFKQWPEVINLIPFCGPPG